MSAIRVRNLSKSFKRPIRTSGLRGALQDLLHRRYEEKKAVDDLSFDIPQGEIVGYLGPNGAGKSTSIKMLVGILVPTSGDVTINGLVPYRNRAATARGIGVVFGQRSQLWWDIPVSETFQLMKYMYKIPDNRYKRNIELFADVLGIQEFMHVAVRQLSLGQRMRADLCAALLHNPSIVFLDEPTIGLDVVVKKKIREFLLEVNAEYKTTILLTTHDMQDVEKLCSRIILINNGTKAFDGPLERMKTEFGAGETLSVQVEGAVENWDGLRLLGVGDYRYDPESSTLTVRYDKRESNPAQLLSWIMGRASVVDFTVKPPEVEDIIRAMYTNPARPVLQEVL